MRLKRSKRWLLCLCGAFLLCQGFYFWHWATERASDDTMSTTMPAVVETSWIAYAITYETEYGDAAETILASETTDGVDPVEPPAPGLSDDWRYIGMGLMVIGAALAIWYLLGKGNPTAWLFLEAELLLTAAFLGLAYLLLCSLYRPVAPFFATALAVLGLMTLRSFLCRLRRRPCRADLGAHRLGTATGSAGGYGGVALALTAVCLTGGVLLWMAGQAFPGILLYLYAFVPGVCLLLQLRDVDHLTREIERLHRGEAVEPSDGCFAGSVAALGDLQRQRDEAVRNALASERFKVELISNVSHDLRTPLTAILGYGELLTGEHLSAPGKERLALLNRKAGYMRNLVEDLFELTKISIGVVAPELGELDLIRLLEQTVGLVDDKLRATGLEVRRYYPEPRILLTTSGNWMHQVFTNLLENAIKYALKGTRIYLEVHLEADSAVVRLTNTASYDMDFSPQEIVQRFARGDKARTTKGSGIGLAIAQTYTETCGGTFRVEVDGDQFRAIVTLPLS